VPNRAVLLARHLFASTAVLFMSLAFVSLSGCAIQGFPSRGQQSPGTTRIVMGDTNDIYAAIDLCATASQLAILRSTIIDTDPTTKHIRYELVTISDETATVEVRMPRSSSQSDSPPSCQPVPITITARIRAQGDQAWEERFLAAMQRRLGQLQGVDSAPIRGFGDLNTK